MITVFGSINLDLIFSLPRLPHAGETVLGPSTRLEPGGKGANQAVAAARDGADVVMVGAVGRDALGAGALRLLREARVDLTGVIATDTSTGCAAIMVDPNGANAIAVGSGANLLARASQVKDTSLRDTLVLQMEVPALETAALIMRARAMGGRIILNLAPAAELPKEALCSVDVLVVNEAEGLWLAQHLGCQNTAAALRDTLGSVAVVLTQGEAGAHVADLAAEWHEPARKVTVIDTTAAGDCFIGVMAHRLDQGEQLREAVRAASTAAALSCTCAGSQGSLPFKAQTEAILRRST